MSPGRWTRSLTGAEWRRLGWFAAAIVVLHVAGWALFSLGHASVVFALVAALALATRAADTRTRRSRRGWA